MRLFIHFLGLVFLLAWGACTVAASVALVFIHYQGLAASFDLLRLDTMPLELDPLLGAIFTALPNAGFSHYLAAAIALSIFLATAFAVLVLLQIVRLAFEAPQHFREGNEDRFWQTIGMHVTWLTLLVTALIFVLHWDADLYRVRFLVGALGQNNERAALAQIMESAPSVFQRNTFGLDLINGSAYAGYIALAVLAPILLEFIGAKLGEQLTRIGQEFDTPEQGYDDDDEDFDLEAANDSSPEPVQPEQAEAAAPEDDAQTTFDFGNANDASASDDASEQDEPQEVLDGRAGVGERVTRAEAQRQPQRYHYDRDTKRVFTRQYWEELNRPFDGEAAA